jgi:type II secretory pathway component GspD/PulD (secretin)
MPEKYHFVTLMLTMGGAVSSAQEKIIILNFREAPLYQLIQFYEAISGQHVAVEEAAYPVVTLQPEQRMSVHDTLAFIESYCRSNGIVFTTSDKDARVSPDPDSMLEGTRRHPYSDPFDIGHGSRADGLSTNRPDRASRQKTCRAEDLQRPLAYYQEQIIKAGLPPLPEKFDIIPAEGLPE